MGQSYFINFIVTKLNLTALMLTAKLEDGKILSRLWGQGKVWYNVTEGTQTKDEKVQFIMSTVSSWNMNLLDHRLLTAKVPLLPQGQSQSRQNGIKV